MFIFVLGHGNLIVKGILQVKRLNLVLDQPGIVIYPIFHLDEASFQYPFSLSYIYFAIILAIIPIARRHCKAKTSLYNE
ncbi:hypothetical protein K492DRAFT_174294 [Lichtheimia hyalospora FSU 10163]|nr:hypothetical protein K492DRAFT_174294 [Lichtheimia hyalospora FSU 10163]